MQLCLIALLLALAPDAFVEVPIDDGLTGLSAPIAAAIEQAALAAVEGSALLRQGGLGPFKEQARLQCAPAIAAAAEAASAVEGCLALVRPVGPALAPEARFLSALAAFRAARPDAAERLEAWRTAHPTPAAWRGFAAVLAGEAWLRGGAPERAERALLQAATAPGTEADRAASLRLAWLAAKAGDRDRCRAFASRASSTARTASALAIAAQADLLAARCAR